MKNTPNKMWSAFSAPLSELWRTLSIVLLVVATGPGAAEDAFTYRSPTGVVFRVDAEGLRSVSVGEREVGGGSWRLVNPGDTFRSLRNDVTISEPAQKQFEKQSETEVTVRHRQGEVSVRYRYRFDGEDACIEARVENHNPSADLPAVQFTGLSFRFASKPAGNLFTNSPNYIQANKKLEDFCHPSHFVPVGGNYRSEENYGFALSPWNTGLRRTLFWGYPLHREKDGWRQRVHYILPWIVPRRGARTFEMKLRVSPDSDWKHLLAPYREHFRSTFGEVRYEPDHRPFVRGSMGSGYHAGPNNPFGPNGPSRRLDLPRGMERFCDWVIPGMKRANFQGAMFWALGGWNPRGGMYRTDFDVFPKAYTKTLPILQERFREAGLTLGVCTRPGQLTVRVTRKRDRVLSIDPDNAGHLGMIWRRFDRMIERGFRAFYLDSFGHSMRDVKIMQHLREKMGPRIQTYAEHECDIMMLYSGIYDNVRYDKRSGEFRHGVRAWEIYRWLIGRTPATFITNRVRGAPQNAPPTFHEYLYRHQLTPNVADWKLGTYGEEIGDLNRKYLDAQHQWRPGK